MDEFLGEPVKAPAALDFEDPKAVGALAFPDDYARFRGAIHEALREASAKLRGIEQAYARLTGRASLGLVEEIMCDDAEVVMVAMGTVAGDALEAARLLRREGVRTGVARLRAIRPFPEEELARLARRAGALVVIDRSCSMGVGGVLVIEVRAALHRRGASVPVEEVVAGLGGQEIPLDVLCRAARAVVGRRGDRREVDTRAPG